MTLSRKTAKNEALPKGWRQVKLGELCSDISYGYTATASSKPIGPKFLRITDIVSDRINWEDVPYCKIEDSKIDKYTLGIGDIVIARTGATTGYNQIIRSDVPSVFASYLIRCKLKQSIAHPFFISCVLQSAYWRNFIEGIKARSAQPGANAKDFSSFRIPLPTLPEQKAIASLLETWDTAIEKTEALIAAKEKQFEWLLKTFTKPARGWKKSTMSDSFDLGRGRVISKKYIEKNKGIYPVFSSQTSNNGELGKIDTFDFGGDYITWTTDGANAGEVFFRTGKFNCTNVCETAKSKDEKEIYACFIAYYLKGKTKKYVSYVGNPKLMNGVFGTIPIRYPSYIQQQVIAHILNTAQQEIVLLEKLAETYRTQKRGLMQKLLTGKWRIQI